ncbi:putative callose synthase 6 [Camellia lanceoleosa]|uniref:Callose synthase 6 n=1 Tax=Camellia lanceoleosa TaxID=1840588 RepID=A0ACC0H6K7_9ERIC|nr:putative callose synthase 6 [Camellia lanceoleosa]
MPIMPEDKDNSVFDILDWLSSVFGFQLDGATVQQLMDKFFKNYRSWCDYLHCKSHIRIPRGYDIQQLELIYIGLYLLIWGEASNIRFMPECLCYIFHNGKASHSSWRNYDDLNEYFWSKKCFKLGWPMDLKADFFVNSVDKQPSNVGQNQRTTGKRNPKTNFVEARTFCHLYGSFDRLWIFYILAFQALLIVAWSGSLSNLFNGDVSKNVLSIFITSAFLNFLQATLDIILSWYAWRSLGFSQILRYLLKFVVAAFWLVVLPIAYSKSVQNPTGLYI